MTIEIRGNWSRSVLPLPREKVPLKTPAAGLPAKDSHEPVIKLRRVGPEADSYADPGSIVDIYI
jgi:hypothetical protein